MLRRFALAVVGLLLAGVGAASAPANSLSTGDGGPETNPPHDVTARYGGSVLTTIKGKVPTFRGGQIRVLRRVDNGPLVLHRTVKTRPRGGWFRAVVTLADHDTHDKTCFKIVVPATDDHRRTVKGLGCIYNVDPARAAAY